MSAEANKEIEHRWNEEFFNQRQVDALDRFLHPQYVGHLDNTDCAAAREAFTKALKANPNAHPQIDDLIAEGDKVTAVSGNMTLVP